MKNDPKWFKRRIYLDVIFNEHKPQFDQIMTFLAIKLKTIDGIFSPVLNGQIMVLS